MDGVQVRYIHATAALTWQVRTRRPASGVALASRGRHRGTTHRAGLPRVRLVCYTHAPDSTCAVLDGSERPWMPGASGGWAAGTDAGDDDDGIVDVDDDNIFDADDDDDDDNDDDDDCWY